jgi:hypothetical protein
MTDKNIIYVFSDTGKERYETYEFLREVDKQFNLNLICIKPVISQLSGVGTGYKLFEIHTTNCGGGEQYEDMIKKYGIPNITRPFCTRELKVIPIHKLCRDIFKDRRLNIAQAVGIRLDELRRVGKGSTKTSKIYPLVTDYRVSLLDVNNFFSDKTKPQLNLKPYEGNCDFCWKKSDKKLQQIHIDNPQTIQWWSNMELQYGEGTHTFFRGNRTAEEVVDGVGLQEYSIDCACTD